ncbi:MAG: hypothetical protein Q9227_009404 [Pyrenula ochraceoflavens]
MGWLMTRDWPYKFVQLSPAQILDRRELLDRYGHYAYMTPIYLMMVTYTVRLIPFLWRTYMPDKVVARTRAQFATKVPEMPSTLRIYWRRLLWWLDDPLTPEFGARKVHIIGLAYALWLLFLTFHNTGNDYLHMTKRFGHIAVSQLPLQYTMAIKSKRNPVQIAFGLSWEALNPYHRLFGRLVHIFVISHAMLYMNFFVMAGLLSKRLGDTDVRLGLAAFWTLNVLAITAIPPLRRSGYHTKFYRPHILAAFILLPLLAFHVPYTRKYIYQALAAYMFNGMARTSSTTNPPILASIMPVEGTNLIKLCAPGPAWGLPPLMGSGLPGWIAGQHVYLKQSVTPKDPRHPFTIVSQPLREGQDGGFESSYIDLVIRDLGGPMTGWLASKPKETKRLDRNVHVLIEGPYGQAEHFVPDLLASKKRGTVLFVAGGVGATYTLPIYLSLLGSNDRTLEAKFVWFVRSAAETKWVIEMMLRSGLSEVDAQIYITRGDEEEAKKKTWENYGASQLNGLEVNVVSSRPALRDVVEPVFHKPEKSKATNGNSHRQERVVVLCCGPAGLSKSLRQEVGTFVHREGREVAWHAEQFGHGDS